MDFPSSPTLNQTYTSGDKTWKFNGVGWALLANNDVVTSALALLGTAAQKNIGTSGNTVPLLDGTNTWSSTQTFSSTISASNLSGTNTGDQTTITGNAGTATTFQTGRTLAITGDLAWTSPTFDGSGNVTAAGTLATVNSNVGTYGSTTAVPIITVNAKGLITAVTTATLGSVAVKNTGTSGNTVPLLDGTNTWSGVQSHNANVSVNSPDILQTVASSAAPTRVGSLTNSTLAGSIGVVVSGKIAYFGNSSNSSVAAVDISNPASPILLGSVQDVFNLNAPFGIAVSGRFVFVATNGASRVSAIDFSIPTSPVIASTYIDATNLSVPRGLCISGKYAYVASTGNNKITVLDISNPYAMTFVGTLQDNTYLYGVDGVTVQGRYLYTAAKDANMITIVDISNPTSMSVVGHTTNDISNTGNVHEVQVIGKYLYAAAQGSKSLAIFDVSNPASPTLVGSVIDNTNLNSPKHLYVAGNYAYIPDNGNHRLTIVDISNPASPTVVSSVQDTTYLKQARGIVVMGKQAIIAGDGVVSIYSLTGINAPTGTISNLYAQTIAAIGNVDVGKDLLVNGGLNIGGGINSGGSIAASGSIGALGKIITAASATGSAGLLLPHGTAPSSPVNGDIWTTTSALAVQINSSTKTVAFLDSNITGSAATLTTGRTLAITGDLAWTSPTFNGSGNVTAAGTLATVNSNVGTFGSTTAVPIITVNAKGLVTAVSTATLGSSAVKNTGTSGNTVPLLDGTNTWTNVQTLSSGLSASATNAPALTGSYTVSGSGTSSLIDLTGTWNTSGAPTAIKLNITDTSSSLVSKVIDLQVASTSVFSVSKNGRLIATGVISGSNIDNSATVSGTNTGDQTITLTGDVTGTGTGSFAATLATVNSNTGSYGSTTAVPIITVNGKGLITAVSTATLGTAAVQNTGTSGANVALMNGANTWSGIQTFSATPNITHASNARLQLNGNSAINHNVGSTLLEIGDTGQAMLLQGTTLTGTTASGITINNTTSNGITVQTNSLTRLTIGQTGVVTCSTGFRQTGSVVARFEGTGASPGGTNIGIELLGGTVAGYVQAYDVGNGFSPMRIDASTIALRPYQTTVALVSSTGVAVTGVVSVTDDAYSESTWNGSANVPTKNAVRDKIESVQNSTPHIVPGNFPNASYPSARVINFGTGYNDVYTVPTNRKAIFYEAWITNPTGSSIAWYPALKISGSYYRYTSGTTEASGGIGHNFGTSGNTKNSAILLNAGESLSFNADVAGGTIWAMVVEFDATAPIYRADLTTWTSGNNTLFTMPSGKTMMIGIQGYTAANIAASVMNGLTYINYSGSTVTVSSTNIVPSAGSPGSGNQIGGSNSVFNNGIFNKWFSGNLVAGDTIVLNVNSASSSQYAYFVYTMV